ncbi:hypothetical protein [Azospirillum sp. INR13]|uniref:hypothetical protein n=1 Tax=Azospirillum sp. INR13 TaxID=2596919 RepID=UPI00189223F2|nr:hypothetical protein [Azospirillum sp. INR13]
MAQLSWYSQLRRIRDASSGCFVDDLADLAQGTTRDAAFHPVDVDHLLQLLVGLRRFQRQILGSAPVGAASAAGMPA